MTFEQRLAEIRGRGPGFDLLRLAAATIVLLYHSRGLEQGDIRFDPLFRFSGGFIQFGLLAVLIFFAVSGFLVTPGLLRSGDVVKYLAHRAIRIFPALFVVVFVSMMALGPTLTTLPLSNYFSDPAFYLYAKNAVTLAVRYLPGVVGQDGQPIIFNGALWTLNFEVLAYLTLALLALARLLRASVILCLFLASYAIEALVNLAPAVAAIAPERFTTFNGLFVYFAAGAALQVFRAHIPFSKSLALVAFALTVATLPLGFGPILLPLSLPYVVMVCGLSVLPAASLIKRDLSYGVYLIHAPVLVALIVMAPAVKSWWMGAAIAFPITIFLAFLSSICVEAPMLRRKDQLANWINGRIDALRALRARRRIVQSAE